MKVPLRGVTNRAGLSFGAFILNKILANVELETHFFEKSLCSRVSLQYDIVAFSRSLCVKFLYNKL